MAKFKTKLTEMCGIEHPIIQGKYPSAQCLLQSTHLLQIGGGRKIDIPGGIYIFFLFLRGGDGAKYETTEGTTLSRRQGDNTVVGKHAFTFERILFLYRPLLLLVIFVLSNFF